LSASIHAGYAPSVMPSKFFNQGQLFFDNILVVIQGVSRLEALQGALLPDADLVP
jgi:hypothetical protein